MTDSPVTGEVVSDTGVDDLERAYAEIARAPYVFRWGGREWTLPHLGALDYRLQGEIENHGELGVKELEDLFRRLFGEQADDWDKAYVPTPMLFMLFKRWLEFCGAKMGEEPASTGSSETTGEPSRPTSAASTTSASPKQSTAKRAPRKAASRRGNSSI